jgi:predicted DNA-binding ribbon-helix-helix protein
MESVIIKRFIVIGGRKTSVSLEHAFWKRLKEIAGSRRMSLAELVTSIYWEGQGNLSSRLRLFVLDFYLSQRAKERTAPKAQLRIVR